MTTTAKRLRLERLEDRTVPATLLWTGDVDANWGTNTLGNTNWAFDLLPHGGDSLVFPTGAQHLTNTNNIAGLSVRNITVSGDGYTIGGNALTLTLDFTDSTPTFSSTVVSLPLILSANPHTFDISQLTLLQGGIGQTGGAATLTKIGSGTLGFGGPPNTYRGLTTVSAGTLDVDGLAGTAVPGDLLVNGGTFQENGDQIADTSAVTVSSGSFFFFAFSSSDTVGSITFGASSTLLTGASDRLVAHGTVQLGGRLELIVGSNIPVGTALTIIDNDGTDQVVGTFTDLPQGATINVGDNRYVIDYHGGTGNDVVLTRVLGFRVTRALVNDGAVQRSRVNSLSVTFSDPATFATTPDAAFRLVRNTDNVPVSFTATAMLVGGVTVVTLDNFGGSASQFGSLADGRYTLTILALQVSFGEQRLDGNNDGIPGDDFTFSDAQGLFRLFGDINGDQHVDIADFGLFSQSFFNSANYIPAFDFNNDGVIDIADFGQFAIRMFTVLP